MRTTMHGRSLCGAALVIGAGLALAAGTGGTRAGRRRAGPGRKRVAAVPGGPVLAEAAPQPLEHAAGHRYPCRSHGPRLVHQPQPGRTSERDQRRHQRQRTVLRAGSGDHRAGPGGQRRERLGRRRPSSAVADRAADGDRRHAGLRPGSPAPRRRTASSSSRAKASSCGISAIGRRPTRPAVENNQETDAFRNKGRFQLDEVDNELYIIDQKRVVVFDASTGEFKRGWGGYGMPLSEISNEPIPGYTWDGGPPPEVRDLAARPALHRDLQRPQGLRRRAWVEPHPGVFHRGRVAAGHLRCAQHAGQGMRRPGN